MKKSRGGLGTGAHIVKTGAPNYSFNYNADLKRNKVHASPAGPVTRLPANGKGYRYYLRQQREEG